MDTFLNAGSTMIMLFITIALGYLARKIHLMDDYFDAAMSKLIMTITCPAMILDSVLSNSQLPSDDVILQVLGVSIVTYLPIFVLAYLIPIIFRAPVNTRGAHSFTIAFGNTGFIGFAVCGAILGSNSVLYASIYNIPFNLFIFSVGAFFMARSGSVRLSRREQLEYLKKNLISPTMITCIVALVLALLHVTDSGIIGNTCSLIGAMTPPASMLVIGSTLAKYQLGAMLKNKWAYVSALGRLLMAPAIVFFLGGFMISDPYLLATITLVSAMPAAALGTVMCLTYGGDLTTTSQCMFLTTILSIITIPLVTMCII
jgi:predicted permease